MHAWGIALCLATKASLAMSFPQIGIFFVPHVTALVCCNLLKTNFVSKILAFFLCKLKTVLLHFRDTCCHPERPTQRTWFFSLSAAKMGEFWTSPQFCYSIVGWRGNRRVFSRSTSWGTFPICRVSSLLLFGISPTFWLLKAKFLLIFWDFLEILQLFFDFVSKFFVFQVNLEDFR